MTGRPRVPTKLRVLRGNPGKRPLPVNEPQPDAGRPRKPRHVTGIAAEEWNRLTELTMAMQVLTEADGPMLEATVIAYAEVRRATTVLNRKGITYSARTKSGVRTYARPEVAIRADAWRRYVTGLSHFGLSPSTRGKVQTVAPDRPQSKARKYFGG